MELYVTLKKDLFKWPYGLKRLNSTWMHLQQYKNGSKRLYYS